LNHTYGQSDAPSLINRMLALDLKITLADNDLPKVIKACELAGMEVAFPFLSEQMVEFSAHLTPQQKLNGTQLRWFFKEALKDFLPNEIITKQKHGFGLPFGVWLQQDAQLQQLVGDSLADLKRRGIVRADFIDQLLGQHLAEHAGYHGTMVWVLMMLEQWLRARPELAYAA
jgi:asparagine synthase (glutamine-hydrolysing)